MAVIERNALAPFSAFMQSAPIDVQLCANAVGVPIYAVNLPNGISGMLTKDASDRERSGYVCYVAKNEPSVRQRFTAAHELGHYMLHRNLIGDGIQDNYLLRAEGLTNTQEAEANQFAADLLMPRDLISEEISKGNSTVEGLAKKFAVSQIAMSIRLGLPT